MNQQRPEMDLPLISSSSVPKSFFSSRRLVSVISPEMLRNPLRHTISWAWMCQRGPLSSIGPPCLLSPYRYCVSTTRAFSVPERREGGKEDGPRRAEGRGEEVRRGEQMSVVRGSCGPQSLTKMTVFHYFAIFGCTRARVCLAVRNSQLSNPGFVPPFKGSSL